MKVPDIKGGAGSALKDKRVQIAAAAGAVLGLVALIRKKSSGDVESSAASTGAAGGALGSYDSSATDAYGNLQTSLDNQLQEFRGSISGIQDQLDKIGTGGSTPTTPKPKPTPTPKPKPKPGGKVTIPKKPAPKPAAAKKFITIPGGSNLTVLARRYGTTVSHLMSINPQIKNPNRIYAGAKLRVK